jgi:hypothetical protein
MVKVKLTLVTYYPTVTIWHRWTTALPVFFFFYFFYCGDEISDGHGEVVNETVGETFNSPDLISSHLGELEPQRWQAVGENGTRIFFYRFLTDVCENDTCGNAFDWSIPCVWDWSSKHAPTPTNNITTGVISEFLKNFNLKFFFSPFSIFSMSKFWRNLIKN